MGAVVVVACKVVAGVEEPIPRCSRELAAGVVEAAADDASTLSSSQVNFWRHVRIRL